MSRWGAFAFLYLLVTINFVKSSVLVDSETITNDFNDEAVSTIIGKLIEIDQKVNAIDHKLKDMRNSETINVEQLIAQSVKEYEMQRSLERISQKVDDISAIQSEMKTEFQILNKNFKERFEYHRENPEIQSNSSVANAIVIENLITSYQNRTDVEIASLENSVITIAKVVRELRDSHQELRPHLESYISNENQKIVENIEKKNNEIKNLFEVAQKEMSLPQLDGIDEYLNKKLLSSLEINFKSINKTLLENQKNLISNINANSQDLKRSISKNGELTKTIEYNIQASLGKSAILTNLVRELRDSQKIFQPHLESHILNESQKLFKGLENKNNEIKKLLEVAQKQMTIPKHDDIDEYLDKKLLPSLEINFKTINNTLLENRKNLITNQIKINEGFRENIAKYGSLISLIEHELPKSLSKYVQANKNSELHYINNTMVVLNTSINSIADFLKGSLFEDCTSAIKSSNLNGIYKLFIPKSGFGPFEADCRLDSKNGNGWTVIQRRFNGKENFSRGWREYKQGFGDPNTGEFWIGLEKIHAITSKKPHQLYIEMGDFNGTKRFARYSHFEIGNEKERFYLKNVGDYSGDAGNSLGKANSTRKFSTKDADNDSDNTRNCAVRFSGAWWYDSCNWSNLNGEYNNTKNGQGINWYAWLGYEYSLKYTLMAINEP